MKNQTDCPCCIKTIESTQSLELYFLGEHDEQYHAVDKSAYLKVKQIVAIVDGVKFAPPAVGDSASSEHGDVCCVQSGESNRSQVASLRPASRQNGSTGNHAATIIWIFNRRFIW